MPRYFFNLRYGAGLGKLAVDPEGDELADLDAARQHALQCARELVAGSRSFAVRDWFACSFEVEDANARRVLTVPFSDIVPEDDDED
ncbi:MULTISPECIES: DUF6894 family protein [unclassified Methylobacterium]|jgi:hypothetical protein|uniref:DUF6894 family protein n=1 Tax=unclassified Methylobacterium TaxID=2615210 RepID=UPI0006F8D124|nr:MULTISPECIES: hypothetical protein [unclassified Methylobacterium]KQO57631.1 hypothetical protein ASF24_17420 [Methylobacterium sp. Leaf86]KQO94563.1 hypothetical protein ASF32_18730 [Methylobacterium sp. Leaf91]MBO1022640.1 hypothetical protein [Methylobacterium sp. SD274]